MKDNKNEYEYCAYPCNACGRVIKRISKDYGNKMPQITDEPEPIYLCEDCKKILVKLINERVDD